LIGIVRQHIDFVENLSAANLFCDFRVILKVIMFELCVNDDKSYVQN
jgi:hypothetical protein